MYPMRKILVAQIVKFLLLYIVLRTLEGLVRGTFSGNGEVQNNQSVGSDTKSERKIDHDDQIKIIAVHYLGKADNKNRISLSEHDSPRSSDRTIWMKVEP